MNESMSSLLPIYLRYLSTGYIINPVEGDGNMNEASGSILLHLCMLLVVANATGDPLESTLQYDDGTPAWGCNVGVYRGVWFDVDAFHPTATGFSIETTQYWFWHNSGMPWDTSQFYAEIWNGGSDGPVDLLEQIETTALDQVCTYVTYTPPCTTSADMWVIENCYFSSGGFPMILADGTTRYPPHSFYLSGSTWEPWGATGTTHHDFFMRAVGDPVYPEELNQTTWAGIKAIF